MITFYYSLFTFHLFYHYLCIVKPKFHAYENSKQILFVEQAPAFTYNLSLIVHFPCSGRTSLGTISERGDDSGRCRLLIVGGNV